MHNETWTPVVDGVAGQAVTSPTRIVGAFAAPCAYCGIHCTGTYRAWYGDDDGARCVWEAGRDGLGEALGALVVAPAGPTGEYAALPPWVRDWNEGAGWTALGFDSGTPVPADEVTAGVAAALRALPDDGDDARRTAAAEMLKALGDMADRCRRDGRTLWMGET